MRSGILKETDGSEIVINGANRSFRDREEVAYETARYMKQRHPKDLVAIVVRATGKRVMIREDCRTA
jgi:hypothetical protein